MPSAPSSLDGSYYDSDESDPENYYTETTCSQPSSGITVSDRPGAGRLLGRLYSAAGRALERRLKDKDGFILGIAPRQVGPPPVYDEGKDNTLDDLDGTGRTLGMAYTAAGGLLERLIDKAAITIGKGPNAALTRIQQRTFSKMPDKSALRTFLFVQTLRKNSRLIHECKRLLKYAQSDADVNREQALNHIIQLTHRDPFYGIIFASLGAAQILGESASCCSLYVDPLALLNQKAMISISASELHRLGQQLQEEDLRKDSALRLVEYVQDSPDLFPALRHLASKIVYLIVSDEFYERLARQLWKLDPSSRNVEWQTLDTLCSRVIFYTRDNLLFYTLQKKKHFISVTIPALVMAFLKLTEKLPATVTRLMQCNPTKHAFATPMSWFPIAIYRETLGNCVSGSEGSPFAGIQYEKIRTTLSDKIDYYISQLLREQATQLRNIELDLPCVISREVIDNFCRNIASTLQSSSILASLQLIDCLTVVRRIDHYCWDPLKQCLTAGLQVPRHICIEIVSEVNELDMAPIPSLWNFLTTDIHLERVLIRETGRYHYAQITYEVISAQPWTRIEHRRWWPPLPFSPSSTKMNKLRMEHLIATYSGCLLLLRVPPGQEFSSKGHFPLVASRDEDGKNEYLAVLLDEEGPPKLCTVNEGDQEVRYWPEGVDGELRVEDDFHVFVLRFHPDDFGTDVMDEVHSDVGVDYTGPLYWKHID